MNRWITATLLVAIVSSAGLHAGHWAFSPRQPSEVPTFADDRAKEWMRTSVDAYVLKRLREHRLRPSPEADRVTLIRRLSFDLLGLPPSQEEIREFVADTRPDAYERLVERYLASPHYGERWGQHWLDVVRFAESEGFEYDRPLLGVWRYRDYVIRSLNEDKPFDRFLTEQLAGDQLDTTDRDSLVATGFLRLGPVRRNAGNPKVAFSRNEVLTEMTDSIGTVFLGLTVGCARCHDHRFDDFTQEEYYQLQAFLAATQENDVVLADQQIQARHKAKTDRLTQQIKDVKKQLGDVSDEAKPPLEAKLHALQSRLPEPLPTLCAVADSDKGEYPIHVLKRGLPEKKGKRVRPGYPLVLAWSATKADNESQARLRLARWLAKPEHPLTARVFVNRVWQFHFGRGIVETANDFGFNGSGASHPRLLDHLANEFVRGEMQLKRLHRLIVTSSAYRQSSRSPMSDLGQRVDPNNRLLWHFSRRRLSAEEIRDAMLVASGSVNAEASGRSVVIPVEQSLVDLLYDPAQWKVTADARQHNRPIHLLARQAQSSSPVRTGLRSTRSANELSATRDESAFAPSARTTQRHHLQPIGRCLGRSSEARSGERPNRAGGIGLSPLYGTVAERSRTTAGRRVSRTRTATRVRVGDVQRQCVSLHRLSEKRSPHVL